MGIFSLIKKAISEPIKVIYVLGRRGILSWMSDENYLRLAYYAVFKEKLDLDTPTSFNEKLQWLKLHDRRQEYTMMVDKYQVRNYIAQAIGEEYLIPLLGVWDDPEGIDFDALPQQFVLKCNHNSGLGMCICKDKSTLDISRVKKELKRGLRENYFLIGREWPYKDVPRKIICEKYMTDGKTEGLTDYKFYCFDGQVKAVMMVTNRFVKGKTRFDFFDRDFHHLPLTGGVPNSEIPPSKPDDFEKMIEIAETLSKGIPHVRVDLYLSDGHIYFGELTFFDGSGFLKFDPIEWDYQLGNWLSLPSKIN